MFWLKLSAFPLKVFNILLCKTILIPWEYFGVHGDKLLPAELSTGAVLEEALVPLLWAAGSPDQPSPHLDGRPVQAGLLLEELHVLLGDLAL